MVADRGAGDLDDEGTEDDSATATGAALALALGVALEDEATAAAGCRRDLLSSVRGLSSWSCRWRDVDDSAVAATATVGEVEVLAAAVVVM